MGLYGLSWPDSVCFFFNILGFWPVLSFITDLFWHVLGLSKPFSGPILATIGLNPVLDLLDPLDLFRAYFEPFGSYDSFKGTKEDLLFTLPKPESVTFWSPCKLVWWLD